MSARQNAYSVSEAAREADLDLLEADVHEQAEEGELLLQAHRGDEGLVPVAQVDAAPDGRVVDARSLCIQSIEAGCASKNCLPYFW